uniref:Small ribosomal subunit protein uS3c n=1 Tax=Neochloris aquatica TaxID=3099 RepID=A0A140H9I0_9CHLO|nr:ribosomal protein S3 [Neochloris aquatica]AMO00829.1 ribosomal protein S3 [Neochloris aquatica]
MGQKIHPLGFRVGITKKYKNQWFARFHKHQYAQTLLEDRFLRETLLKLLPEIISKNTNKEKITKISHIKIERGYIPYEIGIQIYAQNCDGLKTAIQKLDANSNLTHILLKNKILLDKAASKLTTNAQSATSEIGMTENKKAVSGKKLGKKNLLVRKKALKLFQERFLKNIYVLKQGKKISRKFKTTSNYLKTKTQKRWNSKKSIYRNKFNKNSVKSSFKNSSKNLNFTKIVQKYGAIQSTKTSRFVQLFLGYTNKNFISLLKTEMNYWNKFLTNYKNGQIQKYGFLKYAPAGFNKKWSLVRIEKLNKLKTRNLINLVKLLQKQALLKLENLRQEFLVLGYLSRTKSFMYFQRIRFIKALRNCIFLKNTQQKLSNKNLKEPNQQILKKQEKAILLLTEKALKRKFLQNKESSKLKFINYLQQAVKEHRKKNIFFYLANQKDSANALQKIRQFTRQQASFLFGIPSNIVFEHNQKERLQNRNLVKNQILKTIKLINRKNSIQKTFQEIFFEQLQKQKLMYKQNIELTPKISLKFYSVKQQMLQTTASFVADAIVDDLEKRKAFRRVIKKAKEDLMRTSKVKGVKIQVSGRLNGAEMARTEWVRSGRVPLQTLRANIDYSYKTAQTIYGIIGVKVWIYKGLVQ